MNNDRGFDDDAMAAGLEAAEIQAVARRQFVASTVVAILLALVAALVAICPAQRGAGGLAPRESAGVRQPSFVDASDQRVAGLRRRAPEWP